MGSGDQCKYSYNSENAHVYENDDKVLGRPAMTKADKRFGMRGAPFKWLQRVKKFSEADWANIEAFDGKIISRSGFGKAKYEKSAEALGLSRIEQWLSMEDWTGYLVGWEGC